ncbi:MAG TPA: proline iminopeptidase-family hydrolase [Chitinophagaceae bacterium]|jgi:proline iminopeptidase|nr:proline iminopeptidase-family hydrolase [Chitinophagaceae bacterium]
MRFLLYLLVFFSVSACKQNKQSSASLNEYFNYGDSIKSGGVKLIPINTPVGTFKVWTKRFGNNPRIKILLLHGGPAMTHEYMECFETFFQQQGFEFYEYDQLGSYYSDQPHDSSLWTIPRFVDEVEQVRKAIGADSSNFYLLGNSWGGILTMEYALKYQQHLKGIIVANMVASAPEYGKYADEVLAKQFEPDVLSEIQTLEAKKDFDNPRYMELLVPNYYKKHICRMQEWPDAFNRTMKHANPEVYTMMQGPSEFGISGRLANWDIKNKLHEIKIPALMVGARFDTMDPKEMEAQSKLVKKGRYLFCPNGSHLAMWDDQQIFMKGVISFINDVNADKF